MTVVVAFGVVSLLGDVVYEGARSILGPYLGTLGASAAMVGLVSGVGEFTGSALRVATGWMADRTAGYWTMTFLGYGLTIVAVPLLGLVGRVDLVLGLVVMERLGKAVRSPARDALLAEASRPLGRGWGFGLHEALDQTGAVLGPLLAAGVLAWRGGDYQMAFFAVAVPGALLLPALLVARRAMGDAVSPAAARPATGDSRAGMPPQARRYLAFVALTAAGLAPFPLIALHAVRAPVLAEAQVPLLFAAAMAVDAAAALAVGRRYDRRGLAVLAALPLLSVVALLVFGGAAWLLWLGGIAWGAAMGIQESTLRAAVADLRGDTPPATAYGLFHTAYGLALLAGGAALGALYDWSAGALVGVVVGVQAAAWLVLRGLLPGRGGRPSSGGSAPA
jgi:MFS family permease